jgi:hypothetical protein
VHHLVDLANDEDVGSQGVVDAAYKDRHSSPRVVGGNDPHRCIDESQCAFEEKPRSAESGAMYRAMTSAVKGPTRAISHRAAASP